MNTIRPERARRIEDIRRQIAEGTFDTEERFAAAVERMFDVEGFRPRQTSDRQRLRICDPSRIDPTGEES